MSIPVFITIFVIKERIMIVKVFVLGRPGSGKSTAARYIIKQAKERGIWAERKKDYPILHQMFLDDTEGKFLRTSYGGFDVLDFSVIDEALKRLEQEITFQMDQIDGNGVMTIEFARDEYITPLGLFDPEFLRGSYFLFVDADLETCIQRIHTRVAEAGKPDCHFVSDYIMHSYYSKECDWEKLRQEVDEKYSPAKVQVMHNVDDIEEFLKAIGSFADSVFSAKPVIERTVQLIGD
ncbi:MAG: hypothetical protein J2P36_39720 [Ktedonobacteraceae bacterium]|nr:hypothetical protein [Ktedonobacteraceae bacterium]